MTKDDVKIIIYKFLEYICVNDEEIPVVGMKEYISKWVDEKVKDIS
jgi:hypothetical protein